MLGLPSVITTDQGSEFRNQLNAELTTTFGIKHRLTTAYHPQANGLDERYNQTLINSLSKFAQQCRGKWDDKLAEVVYAYNTAVQESSRCTPFEAMFGRQAKLPIDFNLDEDYDPDKKLKQHLGSHDPPEEAIAMNRKRIEETVKKNVEKAQRKQKEYYDAKHGASSCYTIGSLVYKKDFRRKKRRGGKLDNKWEGPFVIAASLGKGLFKLHEVNGTKASYYNYMFVSIYMHITYLCPYTYYIITIFFLYLVHTLDRGPCEWNALEEMSLTSGE